MHQKAYLFLHVDYVGVRLYFKVNQSTYVRPEIAKITLTQKNCHPLTHGIFW